tara:strand:+ start:6180 stop:8627 length:2448 start_codon:yes stop_codon:yes gene_type:complete
MKKLIYILTFCLIFAFPAFSSSPKVQRQARDGDTAVDFGMMVVDFTASNTAGVYNLGFSYPLFSLDWSESSGFVGEIHVCDTPNAGGASDLSASSQCNLVSAIGASDLNVSSFSSKKRYILVEITTAGTGFLTIKGTWDQVAAVDIPNVPMDLDGNGINDYVLLSGDYNGDGYQNAKDAESAVAALTDTEVTVRVRGLYGVAGLTVGDEDGTPVFSVTRSDLIVDCIPGSGFVGFDETQVPSITTETPVVEIAGQDRVQIRNCLIDGAVDASYAANETPNPDPNNAGIILDGGEGHILYGNYIKDTDGDCMRLRPEQDDSDTLARVRVEKNICDTTGKQRSTVTTANEYHDGIYLNANIQGGIIEKITLIANECVDVAGACVRTNAQNVSGYAGGRPTTNATRVRDSSIVDLVSYNSANGNTGNAGAIWISGSEDIFISGGRSVGDQRGFRLGSAPTSFCSTGTDNECIQRITMEGFSIVDAAQQAMRLADWSEQIEVRDLSIQGGADGFLIDSPSKDLTFANVTIDGITDDAVTFSLSTNQDISGMLFQNLVMKNVGDLGFYVPNAAGTSTIYNTVMDGVWVDNPSNSVIAFASDSNVDGFEVRNFRADLTDSGTGPRFFDTTGYATGQGISKNIHLSNGEIIDCNSGAECIKLGRWGADSCTASGSPNSCCVGADDGPTCGDSGPGSITNVKFLWYDIGTPTGAGIQGVDFQDEQVPAGQEWHIANVVCLEDDTARGVVPGDSGFDCVGSVGREGHANHRDFTATSEFIEDEDPLVNTTDQCEPGQTYRRIYGTSGSGSVLYTCEATTGFTAK